MYTFKKSVPVTTFVTEEVETTLVEYIGLKGILKWLKLSLKNCILIKQNLVINL